MKALGGLLLCIAMSGFTQTPTAVSASGKSGRKGITLRLSYPRSVPFTTHEGTWMNVDVSPDGTTLVFDLLGDIYTLPTTGGTATRVTSGPALDAEPRFSPDGRTILFVRDGGDGDRESTGLWRMDADGGHPSRLVAGPHRGPAWSADGAWIAASTDGTVMLYRREGDLAVVPGMKIGAGSAALFSSDGRFLHAARVEKYGPKANMSLTQYDRATGATDVARLAGVYPLLLSADGTQLVGAVVRGATTALVVQNLVRDTKRWLLLDLPPANLIDPDLAPLPRAGWLPGGRAFVLSIRNKLWRIEMSDGRVTPIPFTAIVEPPVAPRAAPPASLSGAREDSTGHGRTMPTSQAMHDVHDVRPAPDGRQVAFVADGRIWVQSLPRGLPQRLTPGSQRIPGVEEESSPAWSADGRFVAYVSWGPAGTKIQRIKLTSPRVVETLSVPAGRVDALTYTHDGSRLLLVRGLPRERLAVPLAWDDWRELDWIPAAGGAVTPITWLEPATRRTPAEAVLVSQPFTTASDSTRVYATTARGAVLSVRWDGTDRRLAPDVTPPRLAPDVTPPIADRSVQERITERITTALGIPTPQVSPAGTRNHTIVFRGARLITMRSTEVIEHGDLVIRGDRIISVGPRGAVPPGARVIDVSGKTILPGYVDCARPAPVITGPHVEQAWESLADLAYGVTTARLTGVFSPEMTAYAARVNSASLLGPRYVLNRQNGRAGASEIVEVRDRLFAPVMSVAMAGAANRAAILDGRLPIFPLGEDLLQLLARSGVTYVPALMSTQGHLEDGIPVRNAYLMQGGGYHEDPKLQWFVPPRLLDSFTREVGWRPDGEDWFQAHAADAARLVAAGGHVAIGTRGMMPGLGLHFELWTLAAGGMPPYEVLRAGTLAGATALGIADSVGALAPGMLAEFQVLDRNPVEDIRQTMLLRYVMRHGHLYAAESLNEIWPAPETMPAPWWIEHASALRLVPRVP